MTINGAAANVSITAENTATAFLFHFDDAEEPFLNLGTGSITSIEGSASIVEGGKFGNCLFATENAKAFTTQPFGGKDFTVEFWNKTKIDFVVNWGNNKYLSIVSGGGIYKFYYSTAKLETTKPALNEWQHLAMCYSHDEGKIYCFVGGQFVGNIAAEITRGNLQHTAFYRDSYADEYRILDGVCAWTSDFTPPDSPYSA